jgi:RNA polymerase sigma-70 factor (ECF subfamily)
VTTDRDRTEWFEETYDATRHAVWRYLLRRLPRAEAEDAYAEVYARAWQAPTRPRGPELPWLYGIARHVVAGTLRRTTDERRRTAAGGAGPAAAAGSAEEVTAGRLDALAALARLTAAEREAVRLVAWEGLSPGQAARVAGCSTAQTRAVPGGGAERGGAAQSGSGGRDGDRDRGVEAGGRER